MRVIIKKTLEDGTKVTMKADGEPGATREQVEKAMLDAFEKIQNGDYESIDAKDIDGHLPVRNIRDITGEK